MNKFVPIALVAILAWVATSAIILAFRAYYFFLTATPWERFFSFVDGRDETLPALLSLPPAMAFAAILLWLYHMDLK